MRIVVVSRPDYFEGEAMAVNQLFEQGMEILHLRKPVNDIGRFRTLLHGIDPLYHSKIAIHHHHELAGDGGRHRCNPAILPELRSEEPKERLQRCEQQREDQCEVAANRCSQEGLGLPA